MFVTRSPVRVLDSSWAITLTSKEEKRCFIVVEDRIESGHANVVG